MAAFLAPFTLVLRLSSGTPFYPLFKGNQHGAFLVAAIPLAARIHWTLTSLLYPKILVLFVPAILAIRLRRTRDAILLYLAAALMTAATAWLFTNQNTANLFRLCSPPLFTAAFFTLGLAARRWKTLDRPDRLAAVGSIPLIIVVCAFEYSDLFRGHFPMLLLAALVLAAFAGTRRPKAEAAITFIALAILAWSALATWRTLHDNTGVFAHVFGFALAGWIAIAAATPPARIAARVAAAALAIFFAASLVQASGLLPAAPILLLGAVLIACLNRFLKQQPAKAAGFAGLAFLLAINVSLFPATLVHNFNISRYPASPPGIPQWSYGQVQSLVPESHRLFVLIPEPYHLNFARNPLLTCDDSVEFISPPPGLDSTHSPAQLHDYFINQNIHYLLLSPQSIRDPSKVAPKSLRDDFITLAATSPRLFESPDLLLLRLP
jgi:hypothetical protein